MYQREPLSYLFAFPTSHGDHARLSNLSTPNKYLFVKSSVNSRRKFPKNVTLLCVTFEFSRQKIVSSGKTAFLAILSYFSTFHFILSLKFLVMSLFPCNSLMLEWPRKIGSVANPQKLQYGTFLWVESSLLSVEAVAPCGSVEKPMRSVRVPEPSQLQQEKLWPQIPDSRDLRIPTWRVQQILNQTPKNGSIDKIDPKPKQWISYQNCLKYYQTERNSK